MDSTQLLSRGHPVSTPGRTDLLLRFFHSEFFDEWIAVSYLWRTRAEVSGLSSGAGSPGAF